MQSLSSSNNIQKTQNLTGKSQIYNNTNSSLYSNDQQNNGTTARSATSTSNGSGGTGGGGQGGEVQYRNSNRSSLTTTPAISPASNNRQTLRLGTVTIGEYHHLSSRKEPEKFDFIATSTKRNDSGDTTPTNETLQSELHSTLARSKLKKSNGGGAAAAAATLEHQRNCPLNLQNQQQQQHNHHHHHHQQQQQSQRHHHHPHPHHHQHPPQQFEYQNVNFNTFTVSEMAKKLQKTSLNSVPGSGTNGMSSGAGNVQSTATTTSTAGGILKNGNRNNSNGSSSNKSTEKSIKFG